MACLDRQIKLIDQFVPTDPANLSSLPVDPSGRILAATLVRDGAKLPFNAGVWQRAGWLHFAVDPAATAAALRSAGVDYVAQRLATVYQATNVDAAQRLMNQLVSEVGHGAPACSPSAIARQGFPLPSASAEPAPRSPPTHPPRGE